MSQRIESRDQQLWPRCGAVQQPRQLRRCSGAVVGLILPRQYHVYHAVQPHARKVCEDADRFGPGCPLLRCLIPLPPQRQCQGRQPICKYQHRSGKTVRLPDRQLPQAAPVMERCSVAASVPASTQCCTRLQQGMGCTQTLPRQTVGPRTPQTRTSPHLSLHSLHQLPIICRQRHRLGARCKGCNGGGKSGRLPADSQTAAYIIPCVSMLPAALNDPCAALTAQTLPEARWRAGQPARRALRKTAVS